MPTESDNQAITSSASSSPATSPNDQKNGCGSKHTTMSHDPTAYVARARVTRPEPPKPSYNPMQFVQIKPCNLFKSAQEQLKRAEEVKKVKEIKKEEPEEWQNNLDNWKSSRRKRVEHIIDRVVEVKKLELEEHDRTRRKSATFSEMLEKRGERRGVNKLASLSVYNEDESNDLSDLGIGASSASGKSSISEDYETHSAMTNNDKVDANDDPENNINNNGSNSSSNDLVITEDGEETNNRDTCEYTYESAIQDYKTRVSRASSNGLFTNNNVYPTNDSSSGGSSNQPSSNQIRRSSKIEEKLSNFEGKSTVDDSQTVSKTDLPKVDISKRKELFEVQQQQQQPPTTTTTVPSNSQKRLSGEFTGTKSIKERLSNLEKKPSVEVVEEKKPSVGGDVSGIRERLQNVEKTEQIPKVSPVSDVPVPSLKDRLSSLQSAATKEEVRKPVLLVDEQQVELMRKEDEELLNKQKLESLDESFSSSQEVLNVDTDREDSGIHTTDVSCSVSQTDEQPEITHINEDTLQELSSKPETPANLELSVNEALELALKAIDEEGISQHHHQPDEVEPIYEVIQDDEKTLIDEVAKKPPQMDTVDSEPYYQVPKPIIEPYYEVPKSKKPIPVYENIEIFFPTNGNVLEPPTEKPPPPPPTTDDVDDDGGNDTNDNSLELYENAPMKRINSTKRIKNEIRNKRSSFLGIEGNIDDLEELSLAPPPDMAQLLQEEKRLEKQLYLKAGLYDSSDTGDSRDSGVSENHSRQSSEPFTNSSEEADRHEDLLSKKEKEIIEVLEKEEEKQKRTYENITEIQTSLVDTVDSSKIQSIEDQIREQEEVLRVERELLQLEQEEIKRQRENLMIRETMTRRELQNGAKMFMSANPNHRSLQDINNVSSNIYANVPTNQLFQIDVDYRKSMSDLSAGQIPPTKPMRTYAGLVPPVPGGGLVKIATSCYPGSIPAHLNYQPATVVEQPTAAPIPLRNYQTGSALQHGNMSRNTLHALSAAPKPKYTDAWVNQKQADKRKSAPNENFNGNYHNHWLIQEAEQRRIEQQRLNQHKRQSLPLQQSVNNWSNSNGNTQHHHHHHQTQQHPSQNSTALIQRNGSYDNKPLPDSVIQTITQRVQSKGIGERMKRLEARSTECLTTSKQIPPPGGLGQPMKPLNSIVTDNNNLYSHVNHNSSQYSTVTQQPQATSAASISDKVLSVSGKKKCSHCGDELGRGAAMIIESLRLFYHINCFKCCVCHVQLGDGLNGTDVRVRNQKLHCQNCYSSDDGIKFSCV